MTILTESRSLHISHSWPDMPPSACFRAACLGLRIYPWPAANDPLVLSKKFPGLPNTKKALNEQVGVVLLTGSGKRRQHAWSSLTVITSIPCQGYTLQSKTVLIFTTSIHQSVDRHWRPKIHGFHIIFASLTSEGNNNLNAIPERAEYCEW